jgi:hypothetical protein
LQVTTPAASVQEALETEMKVVCAGIVSDDHVVDGDRARVAIEERGSASAY